MMFVVLAFAFIFPFIVGYVWGGTSSPDNLDQINRLEAMHNLWGSPLDFKEE